MAGWQPPAGAAASGCQRLCCHQQKVGWGSARTRLQYGSHVCCRLVPRQDHPAWFGIGVWGLGDKRTQLSVLGSMAGRSVGFQWWRFGAEHGGWEEYEWWLTQLTRGCLALAWLCSGVLRFLLAVAPAWWAAKSRECCAGCVCLLAYLCCVCVAKVCVHCRITCVVCVAKVCAHCQIRGGVIVASLCVYCLLVCLCVLLTCSAHKLTCMWTIVLRLCHSVPHQPADAQSAPQIKAALAQSRYTTWFTRRRMHNCACGVSGTNTCFVERSPCAQERTGPHCHFEVCLCTLTQKCATGTACDGCCMTMRQC